MGGKSSSPVSPKKALETRPETEQLLEANPTAHTESPRFMTESQLWQTSRCSSAASTILNEQSTTRNASRVSQDRPFLNINEERQPGTTTDPDAAGPSKAHPAERLYEASIVPSIHDTFDSSQELLTLSEYLEKYRGVSGPSRGAPKRELGQCGTAHDQDAGLSRDSFESFQRFLRQNEWALHDDSSESELIDRRSSARSSSSACTPRSSETSMAVFANPLPPRMRANSTTALFERYDTTLKSTVFFRKRRASK